MSSQKGFHQSNREEMRRSNQRWSEQKVLPIMHLSTSWWHGKTGEQRTVVSSCLYKRKNEAIKATITLEPTAAERCWERENVPEDDTTGAPSTVVRHVVCTRTVVKICLKMVQIWSKGWYSWTTRLYHHALHQTILERIDTQMPTQKAQLCSETVFQQPHKSGRIVTTDKHKAIRLMMIYK